MAYRSLFSRLGSPRLRKGWLQWPLRAYFLFTDGVFLLCPHTVKRQENSWLSGIPLIRTLTPSLRAPPSHLITSHWPFFQIPSRWGLGFQHIASIQTIARGQETFSAEGYFWTRRRIKDGAEKSGWGMVLTWCWARNTRLKNLVFFQTCVRDRKA